jgi:hypothetical protein
MHEELFSVNSNFAGLYGKIVSTGSDQPAEGTTPHAYVSLCKTATQGNCWWSCITARSLSVLHSPACAGKDSPETGIVFIDDRSVFTRHDPRGETLLSAVEVHATRKNKTRPCRPGGLVLALHWWVERETDLYMVSFSALRTIQGASLHGCCGATQQTRRILLDSQQGLNMHLDRGMLRMREQGVGFVRCGCCGYVH